MDTKFLSEDLFAESELVVETSEDGKELFLSGIMMQGGMKNRNGRIYAVKDIANAVKMINERLKNGESIMGELDHPQSLSINLDRVSHIITEARMDGDNAVGKMKILDTPMGKIAKTLINAGIKIGVSSRGTGAVGNGGAVSNFVFSAMDIVATPSAPEAYPESVMEALNIANANVLVDGRIESKITLTESIRDDKNAQLELERGLLAFIKGLK